MTCWRTWIRLWLRLERKQGWQPQHADATPFAPIDVGGELARVAHRELGPDPADAAARGGVPVGVDDVVQGDVARAQALSQLDVALAGRVAGDAVDEHGVDLSGQGGQLRR